MKIFALFTLAFAALIEAASPIGKCNIVKYPGVVNAIDRFCSRKSIMVPSKYAGGGRDSGFPWPNAHVEIDGNCGPAQWVPNKYCKSQFLNMCANKRTEQRFGNRNCQVWKIRYDKKKKGCNWFSGQGCGGNDRYKTVNL